jgi:hypothetical protein
LHSELVAQSDSEIEKGHRQVPILIVTGLDDVASIRSAYSGACRPGFTHAGRR